LEQKASGFYLHGSSKVDSNSQTIRLCQRCCPLVVPKNSAQGPRFASGSSVQWQSKCQRRPDLVRPCQIRVLSPRASVHTGSMISQPSCIVVHHPPLHAHHPEVILAACGPYKHAFGQVLAGSSQALSSAYSAGAVYSILPVVLRRSTAVRCIRGK
jgi:hypothetical protein